MADDQVKYSDLIADDVVKGLELLNKALQDIKTTMAGVKEEAASLGVSLKNVSTATREQQQATAQNAASAERLSKRMKDLNDEERKVEEIKRRYKKLTDEQIQAVNAFQQALRGSTAQQLAAVNAIDVESKSYNELNAMYNALKDSLNAMTIAERQNTEAGKAMTVQSARIYDTMNELQKSTGKYTLQVGKYRAAFDGLGYSFMQIAREAPSALNINQFFLAISNNIPMFLDQLKAFRDEQDRIKVNLSTMTKGTAEYAEQAGKVMSVGQKLLGVVKSWQFGILGILLLIRKIDWVKLWNNLKKTFQGVKEIKNEITATAALGEMMVEVAKKTADEASELNLVVDRLRAVKVGTDEWRAGIETVNSITKSNLDATTTTIGEVEKVTEAYTKQAVQLAKNAALTDMIGRSEANKTLRKIAYDAADYETARQALGLSVDSKDEKAFRELYDTMIKRRESMNKGGWSFRLPGDNRSSRQLYNEAVQDYKNFINKMLSVLSKDAQDELERAYDLADPLSNMRKGDKKGKEPTEQTLDDRYWEAERALLEAQKEGYDLERALAKLNRDQRYAELKDWYKGERDALKENLDNGFLTQEEYENKVKELNRQTIAIRIGIRNDYDRAIDESIKKELTEEQKAAKEKVQQEEKDFKVKQEIAKRQFELTKHTAVEEKKFVMQQQLEFLKWRIDHAEALGISKDMLAVMKQEYEEMFRQFQSGNYSTGKKNIQGNYGSVLDILFPDWDADKKRALNSVFDQAKEALNSWMDARKAAADQAKELADDEVSAAENALNREIELRNQGYANNVALRERELADAKERQQKALEMQQKAKEEELAINTAMEASSMAVAIANLFKQFPIYVAIPLAATLLGAFSYAKLSALSQIRSTKYREGGVMLLEGGSHESGHDVNLGIGPDGSNLRAEGGEYFAVINKRNSRKYGSEIPAVVNALNSGMFEDRYIKTSDAVGLLPRIIRADNGSEVDLSAVESGVGELVKQGESRWTVEGEYRVERYKNRVRRVKIG